MMRQMKDSGVEWMGQIPEKWKVQRAKTLFLQRLTKGNQYTVLLAATQKHGMLPQSEVEGVVQVKEDADLQQFRTVHKNDFVISLRSFQGGFEFSQYEGVCSPAYQVFYSTKPICYSYYRMLFKSDGFIKKMNSLTVGIRDGKNIQYDDFANSLVPVPPLKEQEHIADYLDRKCAEIDAIIAKQQQIIEKLKEYKLSIITEAVTKGLDPNVPMKDSGVEWIGKIPEHWKIIKMKFLGKTRNGLTYSPEDLRDETDGILVLRSANIQNGKLDFTDKIYVSCPVKDELMVKKGDILICSRNGSRKLIGKNVIINTDISASFGAFMMIFRTPYNSEYIRYILNSDVFSYYLGTFLTSTINQLTRNNFDNMVIPFTFNNEEQKYLVMYLKNRCDKIDELIRNKQVEIETLYKYKKSLIYEVVTGKMEV